MRGVVGGGQRQTLQAHARGRKVVLSPRAQRSPASGAVQAPRGK